MGRVVAQMQLDQEDIGQSSLCVPRVAEQRAFARTKLASVGAISCCLVEQSHMDVTWR